CEDQFTAELVDHFARILQLSKLTSNLINASKEVDIILTELSLVAEDREKKIQILDSELNLLQKKEAELKNKIETLGKIPIPVAEHFATLLQGGEKMSRKRDYILFGAGVIVTTIISILLNLMK
ncbi:MAG: hypothetical protein WCO13_14880, partial [Bacteroidota bacterium]